MSHPAAKLNQNARRAAAFSKDIQFKEISAVQPTDDFVERFKTTTSARIDFSNEFTVNVLPNFVPILCYILFYTNKYIVLLEHSKHAKISAGSFVAYCLAIVYGYILACDCYVRPSPSQHAHQWLNDSNRNLFIEFLLSLPVPDFLVPILQKLTPATTERRGNINFVPSAAGFFYEMHFGRFFPLIMFTNLHDTAAENPSNISPFTIISDYFTRPLYKIENLRNGVQNWEASPAHFLGTWFLSGGANANNQSSYGSRLEQMFQSVFNPVLFRDYQRRSTLASIAIAAPTFANRFMNFYDIIFAASDRTAVMNLSEFRVVFTSVAGAMNGNVKCSGDLASQFKSFSGVQILEHGYSLFKLPTFHHSTSFPQVMTTRPSRVPPADFASAIRFLQAPTANNMPTRTDYPQPTATCNTDQNHQTTLAGLDHATNRLHTDNAGRQQPRFNDFLTFDEKLHLFPKVYVMTQDGSTVNAWTSTAFGFVIESNDFDGTVIPVPNTQLNLGIENTWFADSSVPVRYIYRADLFDVQATTSRTYSRNRVVAPRQTRFPAASLLTDRTTITLPRLNANGVQLTGLNAAFPGMTLLDRVNWPQMVQSFFGFRTADRRAHRPEDDQVPNMENRYFLVWSPYTYVAVEGENGYTPAFDENRTYFLTNLRTIFGTDFPLAECNDGLESMPIF